MEKVAGRLLELKAYLLPRAIDLGFQILGPDRVGPAATSITTFRHERISSSVLFTALEKAGIVASLRHDREGRDYLRFSPHCYNTEKELETVLGVLRTALL
jgi:selenocysteine lyase/cysteine desulfurase